MRTNIFPKFAFGAIQLWQQKGVKFTYSEKATQFCEIFTLLLTTVHTVKSKVEITQNFVAFSEYMNIKTWQIIMIADKSCSLFKKVDFFYDLVKE